MSLDILTPKQAAEFLGISNSTLLNWTNSGILSADFTAGGHRRFKMAELKRFQRDRQRRLGIADPVENTIQQLESLLAELREILSQ